MSDFDVERRDHHIVILRLAVPRYMRYIEGAYIKLEVLPPGPSRGICRIGGWQKPPICKRACAGMIEAPLEPSCCTTCRGL